MIDRLHDVLPYLEHLPPEPQEEAANYIEALAEALEREDFVLGSIQPLPHEIRTVEHWEDPAGAWRDLPDTMLEELEQLRHASPPTPPLEYLSDSTCLIQMCLEPIYKADQAHYPSPRRGYTPTRQLRV
ncbi:MAG: hypothetical protein NVS3B14_15960 [Ktedonobacteraceae bacterium]